MTYPAALVLDIGTAVATVAVAARSTVVVSLDALTFSEVKGVVENQWQHAHRLG